MEPGQSVAIWKLYNTHIYTHEERDKSEGRDWLRGLQNVVSGYNSVFMS